MKCTRTIVCDTHVVIIKDFARQAVTSLVGRLWFDGLHDVHVRTQACPVETTGHEIGRVGPKRTQAPTQPVAMATRVVACMPTQQRAISIITKSK